MLYKENQFKYIIKIKKYWNVLYKSATFCKKLIKYTPSLNVFSLSYLDGKWINKIRSYVTFVTQITLFYNLCATLADETVVDWNEFAVENVEFLVFAIIISFTLILLVRKQIKTFIEFNKTFEIKYVNIFTSTDLICSFIINFIMSGLLVPLSFIIIIYSDNSLDLVLNSLAALFVLELDDQIVDLALNDERSIYLEYVSKQIFVEELINNDELSPYYKLITYNWHYNFIYDIDIKHISIKFNEDYDIYNSKNVLLKLDLRSGEFSNIITDGILTTLKDKYVTFRVVNENMCHVRLFYDTDFNTNPYWEIILDPHQRIIRRRIEKEGKFARLLTEEYEENKNPMPSFGTWFHFKWDNNKYTNGKSILLQ